MLVFDATRSLLSDVLVHFPLASDWSIFSQPLPSLLRVPNLSDLQGNEDNILLHVSKKTVQKSSEKIPPRKLVAVQKSGRV